MFPIQLRIAHACEATSSPPAKKKKKKGQIHTPTARGPFTDAVVLPLRPLTCPVHAPFKSCALNFNLSVVSGSVRPHGLQPASLLCPWDSPGKNTGVGCYALIQRIFPTQGWNPGLPPCRQILCLSHQLAPPQSSSEPKK